MILLTDKQWALIEPLLPQQNFRKGGRPRANDRKTLMGILWVLRTGAQWEQMPREYGSYVTCWRRLKQWEEDGTWEKIWKHFLVVLDKNERIEWAMSFLDGSFVPAKKGALCWVNTKR